jgi:hypothetical protein
LKNRVPSSGFQELPPHVDGKGLKGKVARFEGRNVKIVKSFKKGQQLSIEWDEPKDKGALITLDISSNNCIGAEQKGGLQRICVASGIDLAM